MKETKIYYKKVRFNNPVMIVGLPGIGGVGNLVAEHLRNTLKAKKFATLYSPHFPYQIMMLRKGTFRLASNRFYYAKSRKGSDIVILVGDAQPLTTEGQYEVNERIVEFFKRLGGKRILTIGGYSMAPQYVKAPRVFGLATDSGTIDYIKKKGVTLTGTGGMSVMGSAGMIVAFSKKHKISAACIMGETGLLDVDANSARAVLQVVQKMLDVQVNLGDIDKLRNETERMLKELEEGARGMVPQQHEYVHDEGPGYIR